LDLPDPPEDLAFIQPIRPRLLNGLSLPIPNGKPNPEPFLVFSTGCFHLLLLRHRVSFAAKG